jgi:hypothetical protein
MIQIDGQWRHTEEERQKISDANKGRRLTPEQLERQRITHRGWKQSLEQRSKQRDRMMGNCLTLGKKLPPFTPEHREKIGIAHIGRWVGEKSPMWRGGCSKTRYRKAYGAEFWRIRKFVKQRDGHVCQLCLREHPGRVFRENVGLQIHHIDYDKKNNSLNNLITLCNKHHGQTAHRYEHWSSYFHSPEFLVLYSDPIAMELRA